MATAIDPNLRRADAQASMSEHLTAPLAAGAASSPVAVDATGTATVGWPARYPLLLAAPVAPLGATPLVLTATVPAAVGTAVVELVFAPYTEADALVAVYAPAVADAPAAFSVTLALKEGTAAVPAAQIASRIRLEVVEGILGRMLYAMGAEKARIRRHGREVAAMRLLDTARDNALDRIGAELAVPRFADRLTFESGNIVSKIERESDDDYRRRLGAYRPLVLRTPAEVVRLLNGAGQDTDPNAGPIGELAQKVPTATRTAYEGRFRVVDRDNDFAVGIKLVAAGDPAYRDNFLDFVRAAYLIWPGSTQAANKAHSNRLLPKSKRAHDEKLRTDMRSLFNVSSLAAGPEAAVAPMLAVALIRAARCIQALTGPTPWPLFRAQRADAGSRYELGLGVDARRLTAAELTAMKTRHATLKAADPEFGQVADLETRALLKGMTPAASAADPDGRWLLEPCGLRTVHRIQKPAAAPWDVTYLSHFPTFGMTVSEVTPKPAVDVGGWTTAVAGWFGATDDQQVFAYEREQGTAQVWSANGGLSKLSEDAAWSKTWTHAVAGDFVNAAGTELFLYDRASGSARFEAIDENGALHAASPAIANIGKTWTNVVAGSFRDSTFNDVVFYDRAAGELARYSSDGTGALTLAKKTTGFGTAWTHLATAKEWWQSDLFAYDARAGEGAFYRLVSSGEFVRDGQLLTGLRKGWTHVVTGWFGGTAKGAGLLFYDAESGDVELYDADLTLLSRRSGWRKGWSELIPLAPGQVERTTLLCYDRPAGRGEFWTTSATDALVKQQDLPGLPQSTADELEAKYHAPGDPGSNVALAAGLAGALQTWTAEGRPAWTVVSATAAQQALWDNAKTQPPSASATTVFGEVKLPAVQPASAASVVQQLKALPPELVSTIKLSAAQSTAILGNAQGAADDLGRLVSLLMEQQLTSALPLVTGPAQVVLVVGVIPLPVAGINLFEQITTGFRWYVVPLEGPEGRIRTIGSRTQFAPAGEGLSAIVAIGYARRGNTDPYEFRAELPPGALLTLQQYEFLMNLLDHVHPAGVRVNTYEIRRGHVDWKSTGTAEPLDPTVSRTYRGFRRSRHRGETSVTVEDA